jgi:lipoprotein NlpI
MLNEMSEDAAFKELSKSATDNQNLAQRLTEAYFYLAKRHQLEGNYAKAITLYKLALSFNVYEYVEHRYALLELGQIFSDLREVRKEQLKLDSAKALTD